MPGEHSRLSPSSMLRILQCPGSAIDNPPDRSSVAADKGTYSHGLGERILRGEEVADSEFPDDETRASVFEYVAFVRAWESHEELEGLNHPNSEVLIEQRIVSQSLPDLGGTIDCLIVSDKHIHVIDFKDGVMPVQPEDNKQLLSYLVLAREAYPGRKRFFGSICQPRVFGDTRCVEFTDDQVCSHHLDIVLIADDTTLKAGEHCRWCPLAQNCVELQRETQEVVKQTFDDGWTAEQCKRVLAMQGVVNELASLAQLQIAKLMKDGEKIPGWKLVRSLANRAWRDSDDALLEFVENEMPDDVIFAPRKLKSPAQLEKFSKAYRPLVAKLAHREEKGIIAVTADSKLEEWDPREQFTVIEDITIL